MPNKPDKVYTGEKIQASHMNKLVDYYNEIWSGGTYTFDANHNTKNDDRRFGWGQGWNKRTSATTNEAKINPPVVQGKIIEANDMNQAIVQINAGQYHISDDPTKLLSKLATNHTDPISPVLYNQLVDKVATFETNKYKVDWSDVRLNEVITTNTTPWHQDLECVHKFTWTDTVIQTTGNPDKPYSGYDQARHFFNSGGEFTLELSMQPGSGLAGNDTWRLIFEHFDSIRVGAETCRLVQDDGANSKDVLSTSTMAPKGFYNGITHTGDWITILDAGVFRYGAGDYAYAYVYSSSAYSYGEYNSRRIRLRLKAIQENGEFSVLVKVILVEDQDDIFPITQPVTLTSGYSLPTTTPSPSDGNTSYFTLGTLHQFLTKTAPQINEFEDANGQRGWKSVDVISGSNFVGGQAIPPTISTGVAAGYVTPGYVV